MKIIQKDKDLANKHRYWVETSEGKARMIKFDKSKTDEEVFTEVQLALDKENEIKQIRQAEIDEEIALLQAERDLLN